MNVEEMKKRAEAATDGTWTAREQVSPSIVKQRGERWWMIFSGRRAVVRESTVERQRDGERETLCGVAMKAEDVDFILHARADVLALLAERERLDALLAALRSVDERELPEHVAAALRALDTPATQPTTNPLVSGR